MPELKHLAIIMDGNGRWANQRGHSRVWGHLRGARAAKDTIRYCAQNNIETLSLFAFSTENWQRPKLEINFLMRLLARNLLRELKLLQENNIRFVCIGRSQRLPKETLKVIDHIVEETKNNKGMTLVFAVSYSGRQDLQDSIVSIAEKVASGELSPKDLTEDFIGQQLATSQTADPDLIVRTSGEYRLSNFYLWQAAYSEFYFTDKLWPDFTAHDLKQAIDYFYRRNRRFGRVENSSPKNDLQASIH